MAWAENMKLFIKQLYLLSNVPPFMRVGFHALIFARRGLPVRNTGRSLLDMAGWLGNIDLISIRYNTTRITCHAFDSQGSCNIHAPHYCECLFAIAFVLRAGLESHRRVNQVLEALNFDNNK